MIQKKGVGTRSLKILPAFYLPENSRILNSPHTSVRRNGLVEGHTNVNHVRLSLAYFPREQMTNC